MTLPDARARVERRIQSLSDEVANLEDAVRDVPASRKFRAQLDDALSERAALTRVLAELDRLPRLREALPTLEQLHRLEWSGYDDYLVCSMCPACEQREALATHAPACWIARLTAALETPTP